MTIIKEPSLYKIRDMALESGKSVYNAAQLSNLMGKDRRTSAFYLSRLVSARLLQYGI